MAVPKKKVSKSRRNKRRSHISVENLNIVLNKTTGEPQLQHHISIDGYYNGKKVIAEKVKKEDGANEVSVDTAAQPLDTVVAVDDKETSAEVPAKKKKKADKADEDK